VVWDALRLWGVVLAANILGTSIFGVGLYFAHVFDATQRAALSSIAAHAAPGGFWDTFLCALFAGWLIALMVWPPPAAETARVGVIIIITYLAGSAQVFYALAENSVSLATALGSCFLPTLIGNVVGGVALVAAVKICMYL